MIMTCVPSDGGFVASCDLVGAICDIAIAHIGQVRRDVQRRRVTDWIAVEQCLVAILKEARGIVDRNTSATKVLKWILQSNASEQSFRLRMYTYAIHCNGRDLLLDVSGELRLVEYFCAFGVPGQ